MKDAKHLFIQYHSILNLIEEILISKGCLILKRKIQLLMFQYYYVIRINQVIPIIVAKIGRKKVLQLPLA